MEKIHQNKFLKGIQQDIDRTLPSNESYLDAENVILTGDNTFYALENIKGTTEVATILASMSASATILNAFNCRFTTSTGSFKAFVIFVKDGTDLKVVAYDLDNDTTYELFTDADCYGIDDVVELDGFQFAEGGLDIIYFTDNVNEPRKLRCEIPSPFVANALTSEELTVLRRSPNAYMEWESFPSGGSLLNGAYQFSVRFYNSASNVYSKWSILTEPLITYKKTSPSNAQRGGASDFYISLNIYSLASEFALYDQYQLAVVKTVSEVEPTTADLLPLKDRVVTGTAGGIDYQTVEYKDYNKISDIPLIDITVDLAAISTIKTITTKNNRLLGANVTYVDLEYDNGTPSIQSGSIDTITSSNKYDPDFHNQRGYFRDEVYRFYAVYFDDKYNLGTPVRLDLSSIAGNQVSNGDMRFPARSSTTVPIMTLANELQSIGLNLELINHPTWARGVYIFRAKRIPKIKSQSPLIPAVKIDGINLTGSYPNTYGAVTGVGTVDLGLTNATATPMNPLGTLMPKNLLHVPARDYIKVDANIPALSVQKGELKAVPKTINDPYGDLNFIYPQEEYTFTQGDSISTVDHAFMNLRESANNDNPTYGAEDGENDTIRGIYNLYATGSSSYFYGANSKSGFTRSGNILDAKSFDNYSEGTNIGNQFVHSYNNLNTSGFALNKPATAQKSTIIRTDSAFPDISHYTSSGTFSTNPGFTFDSSFGEYTEATASNVFVYEKSGFDDDKYANVVEIVNINSSAGDDRYGEATAQHELVFTGAQYLFNDSELTTVRSSGLLPIELTVYGGDCYVSMHHFKIIDNHYGLGGIEELGAGSPFGGDEYANRWSYIWFGIYGDLLTYPYPYNGIDQVVNVVLESTHLGFEDVRPYKTTTTFNGFQINTGEYTEQGVPFIKIGNAAIAQESDQKVFILNPTESTSEFKARIVYSDQKNYNTFIDGFDTFRALSISDLEETYGGINKIVNNRDYIYTFQDRAIAMVPVDESIISTSDLNSLSVRSGTVVDVAKYISKQLGTKYLYSVLSVDTGIFFSDTLNKKVGKVSGGDIELISDKGVATLFNGLLDNTYFRTSYDYRSSLLWHTSSEVRVYDDRLGVWVSKVTLPTSALGIYNEDGYYILSQDSNLKLHKLYEGAYNSILGATVEPLVTFNINPDYNVTKTFDNIILYSNAALATGDFFVKSENGDQTVTGLSVDVDYRRGYYQIPTLRDSSSARLRGTRAELTLNWKTTDLKQTLSEVITKYRPSSRIL